MLKYLLFVFINLVFTLLAYVLSPIVALFASEAGWLPNWLCWFQTFDASLDVGWSDGYFKPTTSPPVGVERWWMRVLWLCRNPAYGFCYWPLGIPFVASTWAVTCDKQIGTETLFIAHDNAGHFCFMYGGSLGSLKLGWKALHQWVTNPDGSKSWSQLPWGPELRIPVAFTPAAFQFWKIQPIFQGNSADQPQ